MRVSGDPTLDDKIRNAKNTKNLELNQRNPKMDTIKEKIRLKNQRERL